MFVQTISAQEVKIEVVVSRFELGYAIDFAGVAVTTRCQRRQSSRSSRGVMRVADNINFAPAMVRSRVNVDDSRQ